MPRARFEELLEPPGSQNAHAAPAPADESLKGIAAGVQRGTDDHEAALQECTYRVRAAWCEKLVVASETVDNFMHEEQPLPAAAAAVRIGPAVADDASAASAIFAASSVRAPPPTRSHPPELSSLRASCSNKRAVPPAGLSEIEAYETKSSALLADVFEGFAAAMAPSSLFEDTWLTVMKFRYR